ncbi:MAG: DUF6279 family lipoprotein [Burkholderiaceae bacterium]
MTVSRRLGLIWMRIIRPLAAAVALVLLGSCSAVKLTYNNLDDISYWWIDGYADLGELQSAQLRDDLTQLLAWHRGNEMPRVAALLQQVQRDAQADTTPENVCRFYDQVRERLDGVRVKAEPAAVNLAMSLSPSQIKHIAAKFDKGNTAWRRKWMAGTKPELLDKRLEASVERAEQFYGTLEERQRAVLRAGMASPHFDAQRSYAERLRRQQDLLQLLRTLIGANGTPQPTAAQATMALRGYLDRSLTSPDPVYRAYAQAATLENCQIYAQLHNSTNSQQRERAGARIAAYERDARELARAL